MTPLAPQCPPSPRLGVPGAARCREQEDWGAAPTDTPRPAGVPPSWAQRVPSEGWGHPEGASSLGGPGGPMHLLPPPIPKSSVHPFPPHLALWGPDRAPHPGGHPPLVPVSSDTAEAPHPRCHSSVVTPCLSFPTSSTGGGFARWSLARDGTPTVGTVPPYPRSPCARLGSRAQVGAKRRQKQPKEERGRSDGEKRRQRRRRPVLAAPPALWGGSGHPRAPIAAPQVPTPKFEVRRHGQNHLAALPGAGGEGPACQGRVSGSGGSGPPYFPQPYPGRCGGEGVLRALLSLGALLSAQFWGSLLAPIAPKV